MRSYSYRAPKARRVRVRARDFCFRFVLEGENGGQVEVRGVLVSRRRVVRQQFTRPPRAQRARQGEFSFVVSERATACPPGFFVFFVGGIEPPGVYSAGSSSSGNAQSGDVLPACGSGSSEYSEPDLKVSGRGRSSAAGDME